MLLLIAEVFELGFDPKSISRSQLKKNPTIFSVPSLADLIEDIAIAYGYEHFNGTLSDFSSTAHERPLEIFKNALRAVLIGVGLIEVKNFNLTNKGKTL
ncbi:MAG: hypothetical protein HGB26_08870 [Desulfobulbaceae bacterium]|nr:hypothetical protein [Desulfobulbaceae bacterium]